MRTGKRRLSYLTANARHHDLVEMTARKLARFADEIMLVEHLRLNESQVKRLLRTAIAERSDFLRIVSCVVVPRRVTFG